MSSERSDSFWIAELKKGNDEAAQRIWEHYFDRVVRLAKKRLGRGPRRARDEDDLALSAMKSLCDGAKNGKFPLLNDRDSLWKLLVVITARKVSDHVVYEGRRIRDWRRVRGDSALTGQESGGGGIDEFLASGPDPAAIVQLEEQTARMLECLPDETLRSIALLKLEGLTNDEIAERLGCVRRTVCRKLELIRRTWIAKGLS